jgi:hypothetical protein
MRMTFDAVHQDKIGTSELDPFRKADDFGLVSVVVPVLFQAQMPASTPVSSSGTLRAKTAARS